MEENQEEMEMVEGEIMEEQDYSTAMHKKPQRKKTLVQCAGLSPMYYDIERVPKEPPSKRVLCDILHLIEEARQLENHGFDCSGRLYCEMIEHLGLVTKVIYKCNKLGC